VTDSSPAGRLPLLLVHGGLYDDMTADAFWTASGVTPALDRRIVSYAAADRPVRPTDWSEEADALAGHLAELDWPRAAVVAGSDGCSAAARLAIERPELVARLVFAWPATANDPVADALAAAVIEELGPSDARGAFLSGQTLRGVTDAELASIACDTVVWPAVPENQLHQSRTVNALLGVLRRPILSGGSPEPTHPAFASFRDAFVSMLVEVSIVDADDEVPG
jgi:pimeloyl-ACP methyl ester carboxylesterase